MPIDQVKIIDTKTLRPIEPYFIDSKFRFPTNIRNKRIEYFESKSSRDNTCEYSIKYLDIKLPKKGRSLLSWNPKEYVVKNWE